MATQVVIDEETGEEQIRVVNKQTSKKTDIHIMTGDEEEFPIAPPEGLQDLAQINVNTTGDGLAIDENLVRLKV